MSDIIVALITGGLALIGVIIANRRTTAELLAKLDKQSEVANTKMQGEMQVVRTDLSNLREEVKKHNQVITRTYELEKQVARHDEQIKTLFNKEAS